jgi:hypothetical protein
MENKFLAKIQLQGYTELIDWWRALSGEGKMPVSYETTRQIVYTRKKITADSVIKLMSLMGFSAEEIHQELHTRQGQ